MVESLILLVMLATSTALSESAEKDFIYLGSFKSDASTYEVRNEDFDENLYYFSVYPNTWPSAVEDCTNEFGDNNTLVAIESVEEWEFLRHMMEKYAGTVYWTSGTYETVTNRWRWTANNQPLPPFAPWGTGFLSNPNERLRVLVNATNRYDASWTTADLSKKQRYICEVQKSTIPVPCYAINDLIIVLDESGSIGCANYELAKSFVNKLIRAFTVYEQNRIAFITYSTGVRKIIDIKNTFTPTEISRIILSHDYPGGFTYTNLGIDMAIAQFKSSPRKVPLNMVLLTDGMSSDKKRSAKSAKKAISMGIRSFSVGITNRVDQAELLLIAGSNSSRVFNTANFYQLIELLAPVSIAVCPNDIAKI